MTIHASTDLSDYKHGKFNKSITLAEQFGLYMIISVEYQSGWFGYKDVRIIDTFKYYQSAVKCYIEHGGQMRREF